MNAIEARLEALRPVLDAHAGGVELLEVHDGVVRLRFTGMCAGCHLRPLTTASTIRPALLELDEVSGVEIEGSRISAEAEARLAAAFAQGSNGMKPVGWVRWADGIQGPGERR